MTNTTKAISQYTNGNTTVIIYPDGTKVREYEGAPAIVHPESIDVKITDYCDMGCAYCHESSTKAGGHADLRQLASILADLPEGVELAIGGGNPLSHPDLLAFFSWLKLRGIIANITINQGHLKVYQWLIQYLISADLIKGIGISVTSANYKYVEPIIAASPNVVYHLIAGVNTTAELNRLIELGPYCKALILGYKQFGLGMRYFSDSVVEGIQMWRRAIPSFVGKCTLSFDNLAIEQLNVQRLFTHDGWRKFYMGDDFCFTMYIDAVKQEYAPTSRSADRKAFSEYTLLQYFQKFRNGQ